MNEIERLMAEQIAAENRVRNDKSAGVHPRTLQLCRDFVSIMEKLGQKRAPLFQRDNEESVEKMRFKGSHGRQFVGIRTTSYIFTGKYFWPLMRTMSGGGFCGVTVDQGIALPIHGYIVRDFANKQFIQQRTVSPRKATEDRPAWISFLTALDQTATIESKVRGELFFDSSVLHRLDESEVVRATRHLIETGEIYLQPSLR